MFLSIDFWFFVEKYPFVSFLELDLFEQTNK